MENNTENKGFVISDEDLELFKEWIKIPEASKAILESYAKDKQAIDSYFAKIDRMQSFSHKFLTTPLTPIIP